MDERNQARRWKAVVADMQRQFDRVVEIGDPDLAEYAAAAIHDCILEFERGTLYERDANSKPRMRLTSHFSQIRPRR
jgi:hypothetical protein